MKKIKKNNYFLRTVFTVLLCGFFSMSYGASPIYLSSGGNDSNDGTTSVLAVATLAQALTLVDADGTIIVSGDVAFTTEVVLAKNITIQGTTNTTDGFIGNSTGRFITNSGFNLTLTNLKISGGFAGATGNGGALLLSGGTVNITNVNFDNNKALLGGAIYAAAGTITVNDCTIQNNDNSGIAGSKGGGIYVLPTANVGLNVKNTLIKSNKTATDGGAIYYLDATNPFATTMKFTNCALVSNTAGTLGGGAHINNVLASATLDLSFINTTFCKNTVLGVSGGALLVAGILSTSSLNLINCTITENKVTGTTGVAGTGIRLLTPVAVGRTFIYNSIIENNTQSIAPTSTSTYADITIQGDNMAKLTMLKSIVGRYGGNATAITNFNTAFGSNNIVSYVTYSGGLTGFKANFGTFNTTSNFYPLLTGSSALSYGLNSYLTSLTPSITTDQIGNPRDQAPLCDAGAIQEIRIVATPPPTLTADATNNTVDNAIDITYTSDPTWQAAITAVKVGSTALIVTTDYVITNGNIQLKPSGLNTLLTVSGPKSITVTATGYNDAIVSQDINAGVPTKLTMRRQPTAPATNGAKLAVQPQVNVQDQYSNNIFVTDKVTGLPSTGNWTIGGTNVKGLEAGGYVNFSSMTATTAIAVTGATITFTLGSLTPVVSAAFDIPAPVIKTWTGTTDTTFNTASNWSDAAVPTSASWITIPSFGVTNFPAISSATTVVSITIETGASLTLNSGNNLTVSDAIVNNGTLTIENDSNLIQANNTANSGTGTTVVKRNSNPLKRLDFTLWSSPVTGSQTLADFSPLTSQSPNRFYSYDPIANQYVVAAFASPFATGAGYLIRMPNEGTANYNTGSETLSYPGQFIGTPNNGPVSVTTSTSGAYYSVGNPYPSTINAAAFLLGNTTDGTLYFWRKTNNEANSTGSAYATWTTFGTAASNAAPNNITPNGTIQVGQGFIVKSNSTSLSFTNAMRLGTASTQFFKTKQVAEKSRLWLNLTNATGAFSQALVGYVDGATTGVDNGIDGKYINDSPVALTSNINNEEYTIQGRPTFDATDVVALNFKTDAAGDYTIAIDHTDGVFANGQDIYLVDSKAGTETDLKAAAYNFTAAAGIDNSRFSLKYQKTLKVDVPAFNENSVIVYKSNGTIYVNSGKIGIKSIQVYDVQGRLLAERKNVKATTATLDNLKADNQVVFIKISGEDNSVVTKKVMN
jgi:predicted outer membrane repeat protein